MNTYEAVQLDAHAEHVTVACHRTELNKTSHRRFTIVQMQTVILPSVLIGVTDELLRNTQVHQQVTLMHRLFS